MLSKNNKSDRLPEEIYNHCEKHCKKYYDSEPNNNRKPHSNDLHKLKNWDDCWDCYVESK